MDAPLDVWNEVRVTADGISVTLLSESTDGAVVEDETWFTFDELQEMSPSEPISLSLSDETKNSWSEERRFAKVGRIMSDNSQESDQLPEVGDKLIDENSPGWSDEHTVTVTDVLPDVRCDEYVIQGSSEYGYVEKGKQHDNDKTVADANLSYDESEPVVLGEYQNGFDEYAFPASRLVEQWDE